MSLHSIRAAICIEIKAAIPSLESCEPHGGRFDVQELRRQSAKTPKVLLAILALDNVQTLHGEHKADVRFIAFALAGDKPGVKRDEGVMAITDTLAQLIPDNRWGLDDKAETVPQRIRIQNLFSGQVDKTGVAMWAASWTQRMVIGEVMSDSDYSGLDDFETFYAQYVQGTDGSPVAEDEVQLPQED